MVKMVNIKREEAVEKNPKGQGQAWGILSAKTIPSTPWMEYVMDNKKSYSEYAAECGLDFEEFKKSVRFMRVSNPYKHDKEIRRVRNRMKSLQKEPRPKKIRRERYDPDTCGHYKGYENHPLRGRREYQAHQYNIETGVPIPSKPIDNGLGVTVKEKFVWPFHFMEVGQSIFVPQMNRKALMKASKNWKYSYKRNMYALVDDEYKRINHKFLVSEVYDNGVFTGSRIWLTKKEYLDE